MTSIDPPTPIPATAPPPPRRFLRTRDDRVLGGVAGGLGRAFGVDALIFRIALAALVFVGGLGLLLYGAALVLVPSDDGAGNPMPRERTWRAAAAVAGGLMVVLAGLVVLSSDGAFAGGWLFVAALVMAVGYVVVRSAGGGERFGTGSAGRALTIAAVGLAVLVGAGIAFWGSAWATAAGGGVAVAVVVLALGVALVVAAFRGDRRARWLVLPALLIAFPATVVAAADISLKGGVGERTYRPVGADRLPATYRVGGGELVVDLRGLDWRDGRRLALGLDVGVGHALVLVPDAVCVGARSDISVGYANVFGRQAGGFDVQHDVTRTPGAGAPGLTLDVHMGMGAVEVRHRRTDSLSSGRKSDARVGAGSRRDEDDRRIADRACAGSRA